MIGVVTTSYPRDPMDAAGGFVKRRVEQLERAGQRVEVIAAGDSTHEATGAGHVLRVPHRGLFYTGGAPDRFERGGWPEKASAWLASVLFSVRLWARLHTRKAVWQAVESHWLLPCGVLARAVFPELAHRAHVHGGDLFLLNRMPLAASLARACATPKTEFVFASSDLLSRFETILGMPIHSTGATAKVVPAPIDAQVFRPQSQVRQAEIRFRLGMEGFTLLAAGRLVPIKGLDLLILALQTLPAHRRPALAIAGEGPERKALEDLARETGVLVRFLGRLAPPALSDWMVGCNLFVVPSRILPQGRREGMPLVLREALACGTPVLAARSGGIEELEGASGLTLVAPSDVSALAKAIQGYCMKGGNPKRSLLDS